MDDLNHAEYALFEEEKWMCICMTLEHNCCRNHSENNKLLLLTHLALNLTHTRATNRNSAHLTMYFAVNTTSTVIAIYPV